MRKLFLICAAAFLTSGCSALLYSGAAGPYRPVPRHYYGHPRLQPEVPTGRWDNVMRLPRASTIDVLTKDGAATIGLIAGSDVQSVRLQIDGADVTIARADIVRVDLVDLAGSDVDAVARSAGRGALLGAGAVALVTGVLGEPYWPPPSRALRAGIAIGGVAAGQAELTRRAGRILYLAPDPGVASPVVTPLRRQ
jgi:hypothetical protein